MKGEEVIRARADVYTEIGREWRERQEQVAQTARQGKPENEGKTQDAEQGEVSTGEEGRSGRDETAIGRRRQ